MGEVMTQKAIARGLYGAGRAAQLADDAGVAQLQRSQLGQARIVASDAVSLQFFNGLLES